jgi:hypothetical protein
LDLQANQAYSNGKRSPIIQSMITLLAITVPVALMGAFDAFALKFGAEDRPGFDERSPLS